MTPSISAPLYPRLRKQSRNLLQVGDRIQAFRTLLGSIAAIEVAADRHVLRIPGDLADVVDMIDHRVQLHFRLQGQAPIRRQHPGVESGPNYTTTLDDRFDLVIVKLAIAWDERPAIVVTRQQRSPPDLHRFPKALVGQVGEVENHSGFFHRAQQVDALWV